uniref:Pre-mRNA-splicing factor Syf1-like N-terminal HAT-repeats domain-containing protein n=1 Tax=Lactuca sativa TaxID=4236 RepID=A0A9R1VVD1_LACSA|nr:hypothetical protein LSAT_V11C400217270 [Lactuca sativa]
MQPLLKRIDVNEQKRMKTKVNEQKRKKQMKGIHIDIPRTADDYEKMIRSSPNSSFIWIKYMAFFLSLSEVEKTRSMAERALKTINIREESEKHNVWVAYFNLENEYGSPPKDTVFLFKKYLEFEKC